MTAPNAKLPTQASMQAVPSPPVHHPKSIPSFSSSPNSLPPPGARAPMLRRPSRFDPMETTPEGDGNEELGPRHPLRRIREDPQSPTLHTRSERNDSVSLPGIKALLNAADQPPLVSPFGGSFFQSPSIKSAQSTSSLLDSPTSRTSRFSSLTSSAAESQGHGWWAPEERSGSVTGGASRSSSFSARGGTNGEPDFKRRRSDLPPIPPDADETARLKWQAQSRNASFPAAHSPGSGSGGGLRAMLYPPPAPSSHLSRGSISGTPLASPLSDSQFDPMQSARSSPMTGPLARSFADLHASERSPRSETQTPSRPLSPTSTAADRRPSLYARSTSGLGGSREHLPPTSQPSGEPGQRMSQTRPPSPEPTSNGPRRSSLAELIMVKSGDNVNLGQRRNYFDPHESHADRDAPPYVPRRESTESIFSSTSGTFNGRPTHAEPEQMPSAQDRRNGGGVGGPLTLEERRPSYGPVSEDEPEAKGDPGMRGMEVLAESARRVADAERKDSMEEDQPRGGASASAGTSPAKATGSSGPKYPCQYCKKAFTRPSSLRIHTYSHTGERPYVCADPTCRRRFSVQSNLKRHAKVHHQNNQQPQNAAQMANTHQRAAPAPHPMHMGRMPQPPHPGPYFSPHPHGPPPHPHMVHPSHHPPPGYGPPPPGYMGGPQPHPMHMGPPGHYRGGGGPMRPGEGPMPYHVDQRRRSSHDVGPGSGRDGRGHGGPGGAGDDWVTDEEADELDEDEN